MCNISCNLMPENCVVQFIISSTCLINIFFFYINGNLQPLFYKDRLNLICFLRVRGTSHNDQHYACTYRSEQVGSRMLSRCLVSASHKKLFFCQFIVVKKIAGVFSISYGSGYRNAVKVQNRQICCWRNIVISLRLLFTSLLCLFVFVLVWEFFVCFYFGLGFFCLFLIFGFCFAPLPLFFPLWFLGRHLLKFLYL